MNAIINNATIHTDYMDILHRCGGVFTFEQTAKILCMLDGNLQGNMMYYAPNKYLSGDIRKQYVSINYERQLVGLGRNKDMIASPVILAGLSCALDIIKTPEDCMSLAMYHYQTDVIEFISYNYMYNLIGVTTNTLASLYPIIMRKKNEVASVPAIYSEYAMPKYLFLIYSDKDDEIELLMDKISSFGFDVSYQFVVISSGFGTHDLRFEYLEN